MKNHEEALLNTESDFNDGGTYALAIKCVFVKPKNIRGAFRLLLRRHDSKIIELILWTTRDVSDEVKLEPSMPSEEFSTNISAIGLIDKESSGKLSSALKGKLTKEEISSIFEGQESSLDSFKNEVKELFEKNLRYNINIELEYEPFDKERLKKSGYEQEEAPSSEADAEKVSISQLMVESIATQVVNCAGVVDPVNGIAASQLQKGDIVEVVLPASGAVAVFLSDYCVKLNKTPEYPVKSVEVSENGSYIISLEADGGVTCVVKISSDLRLRAKKGYANETVALGRNLIIIAGVCVTIFVVVMVVLIRLLLR